MPDMEMKGTGKNFRRDWVVGDWGSRKKSCTGYGRQERSVVSPPVRYFLEQPKLIMNMTLKISQ